MTHDEAREVAGRLTRLQKLALTSQSVKDGNELWVGGTNATLTRLRAKGLARGMGRFTPNGLLVRRILQENRNGE